MPDQTKNHVTVTITVEMVKRHMPCGAGLECATPFLPAKLSTDPHKNIKLAGKWVKTERPWDVSWLLSAIGGSCEIPYDADDTEYDWSKDPWVVAQNLAIIADRIATAEGR